MPHTGTKAEPRSTTRTPLDNLVGGGLHNVVLVGRALKLARHELATAASYVADLNLDRGSSRRQG